jgi:undecaprenyl-diphosphatase
MNSDWLNELSAWLHLHPGWLAVALFSTAFVESLAIAGIVVPGVAILFAVAVLAGQTGMPMSEVFIWAGLGAIAGDTLSFELGRLLQGRLETLWPLSRYPGILAKGELFFRKHGGKSIVIGRFVGPVRPIVPLVAGALWMPWKRFLSFNIASAIAWSPAYTLPGFLVGSALASNIQPPAHFYAVIGFSLAALATVYLILFRLQLGLSEGSRFYAWLEHQMQHYSATHHFWHLYTNDRPAQGGEFPLASLMLALTATGLFLLWSQLATYTHLLEPFNQLVLHWFSQLRQPLLDGPALAFTLLGDPPVLVAAAVVFSLALWFRGYYAAAAHIVAATLLTACLVWVLKFTFAMPRPDEVLNPPSSGAFPSGHSAGITVFVTLIAGFIAGENDNRKRWQAYILLSLPLVPVAVSRLYLGVHWFTDIIGGILLGLAITGAVRASYSRYDRTPLGINITMVMAGCLWLAFTALYLVLAWPGAVAAYSLLQP